MRNLNDHKNDEVLGLLTIPPRHLLEVETDGQAIIVGAFSLDGKTGYSPQVVRTRDQLRVTVSELDRTIAAGMWVSIDHVDTAPHQSVPSGATEPEQPATSLSAQTNINVHHVVTRGNILAAAFAKAKKDALDPDDPHSHWAAFVALAESPTRPSPLIGYAEEEGVKYNGARGVAFLT